MARLSHPNIVTVHEMGVDGENVYLVMELLLGGSLIERVESGGALPPRMAVDAALAVASGLQLAHAHGIVHRDIKPHNVMLTVKGQVKIMDFGLASLAGRSKITKSGTTLGTPSYMAPEQLEAGAGSRTLTLGEQALDLAGQVGIAQVGGRGRRGHAHVVRAS